MSGQLIKNLKLLKKISLQKCDILRLEMHEYVSHIDHLNKKAQELKKQYFEEEAFLAQNEDVGSIFSIDSYRQSYKEKQAVIANSRDELEYAYEGLRQQLNELFSEQKSYEITIDDLNRQEAIARKKEENNFFDELSAQQWHKKIDSNNKNPLD